MTDNKDLIERLKAGIANIKDMHVEEGLCGFEQSLVDAAEEAIAALSAQPAPVAAEQSVPGLCDECESYDCVCDPPPPHTKAFEV